MRDKRRKYEHIHSDNDQETCPVCGGVWKNSLMLNSHQNNPELQNLNSNSIMPIKNSYSSKGNALRRVQWELGHLAAQLDLPMEIIAEASNIFQQAAEKDLIRGRSAELMVAASLYLACRVRSPQSIHKIASIIHVDPKTLSKAIRLLLSELFFPHYSSRCISGGIQRICSELSLSTNTEILALRIFEDAQKNGITGGRNPQGIAAASIFVACLINDEEITQAQIAEVANVTEVTVRNRYKEIINNGNLKTFLRD